MKNPFSLVAGLLLLWSATAGCRDGEGSDIGPTLAPVPDYEYVTLVRDDLGRPVTGAVVDVPGARTRPVTGTTGRAFLREFFRGRRVITIDGSQAAAVDSSRLGWLRLAADFPGTHQFPYTVYLPDTSSSSGLLLDTGSQAAPVTLDDTAAGQSGASLGIASGEAVLLDGSLQVSLRTGRLAPHHLPASLRSAVGGPAIVSRGVYIDPPSVHFALGASLSIPDDIALIAGEPATLYHLDPASGTWQPIGSGIANAGRIEAPTGTIREGGLYCFAIPATATTQLSGVVVDRQGRGLPGILVRAGDGLALTVGGGGFLLPPIAQTDGAGVPLVAALELDGGRDWLPAQAVWPVTLSAPQVGAGALILDTHPATNVRFLMIRRGEVDAFRRLRMNGRDTLQVGTDTAGADGIVQMDDQVAEQIGYLTSKPRDEDILHRTQGFFQLHAGATENPLTIHADEVAWRPEATGGTAVQALDSVGTGPVFNVHIVEGSVPGEGYRGVTDFVGYRGVGIPKRGQVTAVFESHSDGLTVTSAFTTVGPDTGRLELPVERAVRRGLGAYSRFGMLQGALTATGGPGKTLAIRGSGKMILQDFYDEVFRGGAPRRRAPIQDVPVPALAAYRLGLPQGTGHLVATSGSVVGGVFTLERLGLALGLPIVEGAMQFRDIALDHAVDASFVLRNALVGLDPAIPIANLRLALAGELPTGLLVDIARDIGGNIAVGGGNDAILDLPAVPAGLSGWVVGFGGSLTNAGLTSTQQIFARLGGGQDPDRALLPLPAVSTPAPGAVVPSLGFPVDFDVPQECHYVVVRLRSETATDVRDWTAVIPWENDTFRFFQFPAPVPQVLVPGRTWTLDVSCARIDEGFLIHPKLMKSQTYARIQTNWVGLTEADRRVTAISRQRFTVTTN